MITKYTCIEYLWFVGPSGTGKTTAVKGCSKDSNHVLRKRLDIKEREVILCTESLDRDQCGDDIFNYLKSNYSNFTKPTAVLIDAQWPDIKKEECNTIYRLRNEIKNAAHIIIWLNCSPEEAARRCRERNQKEWEQTYNENNAKSHHKNMCEYIEKLRDNGFSVEVINSHTPTYEISDWASVKKYCE